MPFCLLNATPTHAFEFELFGMASKISQVFKNSRKRMVLAVRCRCYECVDDAKPIINHGIYTVHISKVVLDFGEMIAPYYLCLKLNRLNFVFMRSVLRNSSVRPERCLQEIMFRGFFPESDTTQNILI